MHLKDPDATANTTDPNSADVEEISGYTELQIRQVLRIIQR